MDQLQSLINNWILLAQGLIGALALRHDGLALHDWFAHTAVVTQARQPSPSEAVDATTTA